MGAVSQYLKVHSRFLTGWSWIISVHAGIQAVFVLLLPSKADTAVSVASWSPSWWVSPALHSGLHVLLVTSLGWYFITKLRSGLCCCNSQMHKYLPWFGSESNLSQHQLQGGKSLFLLHKGTSTGREVGAVAQCKSALGIKTLLQWWLIPLHNSPLDVLDTNVLFLLECQISEGLSYYSCQI